MFCEPQKEHRWLHQLVGDWTYESECVCAPGETPAKMHGSEHVRLLGELWVLCEGQGEMPGQGSFESLMTIGYDPRKGYVGSWIGSMMGHLWRYDGEMDASGKVLTLSAEGPSMSGGDKLARYRDVIEVISPDHRTMTSHMQDDDGQWQRFMVAHYRRRS